MSVLDIGKVAERSGVAPSTLLYYEEIGLIRSVGRRGLRRQYDGDVLTILSLIAMGQAAGFTLSEISGMIRPDGRPHIPRADLHAKADALQRQITDLRVLRDVLRHVADCSAPSHLECPTFRKLMKGALSRQITSRRSRHQASEG